jgi:thiaminase
MALHTIDAISARLEALDEQINRTNRIISEILGTRRELESESEASTVDPMEFERENWESESVMSDISEATVPYYTSYVNEWEECSELDDEETIVGEWIDTYRTPDTLDAPPGSPPWLYRPAYLDLGDVDFIDV